jgi:hypothetical protein
MMQLTPFGPSHTADHCGSDFRFLAQVFLVALDFARAKGAAERLIENAGYRHRLLPRKHNRARLGRRRCFVLMAREKPLNHTSN